MKSIENKILSTIKNKKVDGYAFSSIDFIGDFSRDSIDKALSTLVKKHKIRRVTRGIYDYPEYSDFLNQELSPNIEEVAKALARKFNWRIEISGESALNIMGLSTQVAGRYIYLSDGANRTYDIQGTTLEFKKSSLKNMGFKYDESKLIVQALKALGKEHITKDVIAKTRSYIEPKMYSKILSDTQTTTIWIYDAIKQICKFEKKI
ncbi:MAG: DUF6088 family protein [Campylobacterota bacterium]|nr:DUF6088 family protein [Campylobacterota bacterium]